MAIATGQSGTVKVRVKVFEDGTHRIESVVGKDRFLKDGVVKAVESWKFMKGYPDGLIEVEFSFVLLPHTASESELVTEIYPELNRMIIKSRAAGGLKILDPPALPN
jgi:hypothetical protein